MSGQTKRFIYFCGSIRAGRDDAALYRRIIDQLKEYGEVLTEHVGDANVSDKDQGWRLLCVTTAQKFRETYRSCKLQPRSVIYGLVMLKCLYYLLGSHCMLSSHWVARRGRADWSAGMFGESDWTGIEPFCCGWWLNSMCCVWKHDTYKGDLGCIILPAIVPYDTLMPWFAASMWQDDLHMHFML